MEAVVPQFRFDEPSHTYTLDGIHLPSVTEVLPDIPFGLASAETLEEARQRGRRVHEITAAWDHGTLDLDTVEPEFLGYLRGWISFLEQTECEIVSIEERLYHPSFLYAGTSDRRLTWRGKWVIDIKTTAVIYPHAALQTSAYDELVGGGNKRASLHLRPNGTFRLHEWKDRRDFSVFRSYLNCHNWQRQHLKSAA